MLFSAWMLIWVSFHEIFVSWGPLRCPTLTTLCKPTAAFLDVGQATTTTVLPVAWPDSTAAIASAACPAGRWR